MVLMLCPVTALAEDTDLQNMLNNAKPGEPVTLDKDYTIDTTLQVGYHVILDLNGYVIKMTRKGSVIQVNSGVSLTLQDSNTTATHTGDYASLPAGGVITGGNTPGDGGGVSVAEGGSFIMEGGTIYNCRAEHGGGVYVGGSFTMTGGTITGCSATGNGGGGVYVGGGSFTMIGGAISGCSSNDGGGGVFVGGGSFTMTGGTISDCSAIKGGDAIAAINDSTINANGGTIYSEVESFGQILNTSTSGCTKFYGEVKNLSTIYGSGTISGGIYYGEVENHGTISGGMFYGNISGSGISGKTVTFMKDGSQYALEVVANGNQAVAPEDPTKDDYIFTGWYTDGESTPYDFTAPVTENITLYAGFEPAPVLAITVNGFQVGKTPNDCTYTFASTILGITFSADDIKSIGWHRYAANGSYFPVTNDDAFRAGTLYRCVIDLDSNDLTEVPVVTVNGNTPDFRTFQYSAGAPVKLSIGCDLGTPEPILTLTVPFTATVKLGGSTAPGKTTFELAVVGANAGEESYKDVTVSASVTTNGAGSYEGTMTFKGTFQQLQNMLGAGVFVQQVNAGEPNWTYDDTVWGVRLYMPEIAARSVDGVQYSLLVYPTYIMDNGCFNLDLSAGSVECMSFTNTYTYSYSAPVRDNVPVRDTATIIIGGEKEESKPVEENPNTGAPVAANMSTLSVLVLAAAVAVLKTRKR